MGAKPCHSRDSGGYGADCISRKAACAHHDRRRKQRHRHGRHGCPRAEPRHERRGRAAQSGKAQRHAVLPAGADGADRGCVCAWRLSARANRRMRCRARRICWSGIPKISGRMRWKAACGTCRTACGCNCRPCARKRRSICSTTSCRETRESSAALCWAALGSWDVHGTCRWARAAGFR